MQEKCPVCGKIVSANENKCSECGFTQLHKTFISKIDAEEWIEKVVKPYKTKYEKNKNKDKVQTLHFNNGTETIEDIDKCFDNFDFKISINMSATVGGVVFVLILSLLLIAVCSSYDSGSLVAVSMILGIVMVICCIGWIVSETRKVEIMEEKTKTVVQTLCYGSGTYVGEVLNGMRHGKGKYTFKDGRVYEGDWKNDKKEGFGVFKWTDGSVYVGNYKNNQKNGYGEMTYADGAVYKGQWKNSEKV